MSPYDEPYPWDDGAPRLQREYKRNWKGMPLRIEWNASPARMGFQTCTSCGYKWDQIDFTYRSNARVNGQLPPVMVHQICWNCYMCEKEPHQVRTFWDAVDRVGAPAAKKEAPKLQRLEAR